jgi:hypothetical protein
LVAVGAKQWETRSWDTKYRGPLLIHAAMRKPPEINNPFVIEEMIQALGVGDFNELPRGVVLAVVDLTGVYQLTAKGPLLQIPICPSCLDREMLLGNWANDRYVWSLENLRRLPKSVSARGQRRLWTPMPLTVDAVSVTLTKE